MPLPQPTPKATFDQYTTTGDVAANLRRLLRKMNPVLALVLILETLRLFFSGSPAAGEFAVLSLGSMVAFLAWAGGGRGLPLMPLFALQHLLTYGMPAVVGHEDIFAYTPDQVWRAGIENLVFLFSLTVAWRIGQAGFRPSRPMAYVLKSYDRDKLAGVRKIGYPLIALSTAWLFTQYFGPTQFLNDLIPDNFKPVTGAVTSAASACGFFLIGLLIGSGSEKRLSVLAYWFFLAVNCLLGASSFLLSSPATCLGACVIGLFWSRGRFPWRLLTLVVCILAFLNMGKWTMRDRYWRLNTSDPVPVFDVTDMPAHYIEWSEASLDSLTGVPDRNAPIWKSADQDSKAQSLFTRLNNLSNLLFVMDAVDHRRAHFLGGATYAIIPPLLIPRFLWPEKPGTHEGQVILNVYFGRQDLHSTMGTFIAWGFLPEAYANFGPGLGAIALGVVLGILCAWGEAVTANKPLLSMEGFVAFVVMVGVLNSYEMVASVAITSLFQAIMPVVLASIPFVRWEKVERP